MLSTHIGHLDDVPSRSLELVKSVDLMIFEEDKPARSILKLAQIRRDYAKFSEHHQKETLLLLKDCLKKGGTAAYMSDQGCPTFSDPGADLLNLAYSISAQVKTVPGPSSLSSALSCCPFKLKRFFFYGFLPRQSEQRKLSLQSLSKRLEPIILMDTPYRLKTILTECQNYFPATRKGFLAIDISGPQEFYISGSFKQLSEKVAENKKLNFVLIVEAAKKYNQS